MNIAFQNGVAAELWVASKLAELGYSVLWPFVTQSRYDLVIEKDGVFSKIQVKKATKSKTGKYEYLQSRLSGKNKLTNTPYTSKDVDYFAFTDMEKLWLAPFNEIGHQTSVCLGSSNPNYKSQTLYEAAKWLVKTH